MATIGVRALAMIVGAGYGGTYLYNNMDHARSLATRILLQHQAAEKNANGASASSANASTSSAQTEALSAQMDALAREMSRSRDPVVLVGPAPGLKGSLATITDIFNLLGWAVVAVSVGGVAYYVAVRKNVSVSDLAWVSRSTFNGTVSAMQKGISRVSGAVGAVRRDLGERLKMMESHVDKVRASLSDKIELEVAGVKGGIAEVGSEVTDVKQVLDGVNSRIEQLDTKIDTATTGIMALARVVSSLAPERLQPGTPFYDLKRFAETKQPPEITSSQPGLRQRLSNGGLRALLGTGPGASGDSTEEAVEEVNARDSLRRTSSSSSTSKPKVANGSTGMKRMSSGGTKSQKTGGWNKASEKDDRPFPWES